MTYTTPFTPATLVAENDRYFGSAGRSAGNRGLGFRPAFMDSATGTVYPSCFRDGRPAPVHLLDGLPPHLVTRRAPDGRVCAVTGSIVSGFVRDWRFYTREEAMQAGEDEQAGTLAYA